MSTERNLFSLLSQLAKHGAPTFAKHKGQSSKVAVVGGSRMYTGAPYFAGISSLKVGADLSWVFCAEGAENAIKSYSPELMVLPSFSAQLENKKVALKKPGSDQEQQADIASSARNVCEWLPKATVVVFGPGLGRDTLLLKCVAQVISAARSQNLPIVLDADALFLIGQQPDLIKGYRNAILTPNGMEFRRLWESVFPSKPAPSMDADVSDLQNKDTKDLEKSKHQTTVLAHDTSWRATSGWIDVQSSAVEHTALLARALGGVTIVRKGAVDIISDGIQAAYCNQTGSPRRCGGQGDLLSGASSVGRR